MTYARIEGTGHAVPKVQVSNTELSQYVDTTDEWISSRTGIRNRYISTGETATSLAVSAAKEALERANVKPEEIDVIIVATISPEYFMPSTACLVQGEIGAVNATCFDLGAACSGFLYAMKVATQGIRCGDYKKALVIGSEVLSKVLDWNHRDICVLFGDGAGAAVLSQSDEPGVIGSYTGSDGNGANLLSLRALPSKNILHENEPENPYMQMEGREVYSFAVKIIPKCIEKVLKDTDYNVQDISYFVLHQANERIIDSVAKKMKVQGEKFYKNMDTYGNTSAASIPIALSEMDQSGKLKKGDMIILVGFGGGLTWGATLVKW